MMGDVTKTVLSKKVKLITWAKCPATANSTLMSVSPRVAPTSGMEKEIHIYFERKVPQEIMRPYFNPPVSLWGHSALPN